MRNKSFIAPVALALVIFILLLLSVALKQRDTRSEWEKIMQDGTEYTVEAFNLCFYKDNGDFSFAISGEDVDKIGLKRGILGSIVPTVTFRHPQSALEYGETWSEDILEEYLYDVYPVSDIFYAEERNELSEKEDERGHIFLVDEYDLQNEEAKDWLKYYRAEITLKVYKGSVQPLYITVCGSKVITFLEPIEESVTVPAIAPEWEEPTEETYEAWYLSVPSVEGEKPRFSFFISDEFVYVPPEKHLFYQTQALGLTFEYKPEEMRFAEGWSYEILDEFLNGSDTQPFKTNISDRETEYSMENEVFIADLTDEHGHKFMHYMYEDAAENPKDYTSEDDDWINSYYYSSHVTVRLHGDEIVPLYISIGGEKVADFIS